MSAERFPGAARLERQRRVRRVLLVAVLAVLLLLSALLWPRQQPGGLRVATAADASADGVVRGELQAQRQDDRVCFRVSTADGDALLLLPTGWSSDAQEHLLDRSGAIAAVAGDTVLVTGEPGEVGTVPGCPGTGRVWSVASLTLPR